MRWWLMSPGSGTDARGPHTEEHSRNWPCTALIGVSQSPTPRWQQWTLDLWRRHFTVCNLICNNKTECYNTWNKSFIPNQTSTSYQWPSILPWPSMTITHQTVYIVYCLQLLTSTKYPCASHNITYCENKWEIVNTIVSTKSHQWLIMLMWSSAFY